MMKIRYISAAVAVILAASSCDSDHKPDWNEPAASAVSLASSSVASGTTVASSLAEIDLTYSAPVAVNSLMAVTLNDVSVPASVSSDNQAVVRITLPALAAATQYTLTVPERAVAGVNSRSFAPGVTISFTTDGTVPSGPVTVTPSGLVNPSATQQTKNVYNFLVENLGKKIVSGAMANVNNNNDFASWIKEKTGKTPVINGYDFIHLPESTPGGWIDYSDITPATSHWETNGLVSYMWHWRVPTDEQAWNDKDFSRYGTRVRGEDAEDPTDFDIEKAVTEGTWENRFILEDIDKAAEILRKLQDAGIPVIWRPLHEAAGSYKYNGAWFWWGAKGGEATKALWKLMYDRLVGHHGLNNLIWVWTAQYEEGYTDRMNADYPGDEYVDAVGTDIYADTDDSQVGAYNALVAMTGGKKLIAVSETGLVQNPDKCFADKACWSWFNIWYTYDIHKTGDDRDGFGNTAASLREIMENPLVITLDDMPPLK